MDPRPITVELVLDGRFRLAEGPIWDPRELRLLFVDLGSAIHWYDPETARQASIDADGVSAVALGRDGGYIMASDTRISWLTQLGATRELAALPVPSGTYRTNDGKCDPTGQFWIGTVEGDGSRPLGALWRVGSPGDVELALDGVCLSNGLAWSPAGDWFYYADTFRRHVDRFRVTRAGKLVDRTAFVDFSAGEAMPDGIAVDLDGYVWVALWGGWAVNRYAPDGRLDMSVRIPAALVTSCAFGGPDFADLYVTTARYDLTDRDLGNQPAAGGIFRCRPGAKGWAAGEYVG